MFCINPITCLHDEFVNIEINDITPGADVTLTSCIEDNLGDKFYTYSHYRADETGTVNLSRNPSLNGTYKGIFAMGPIACLRPGPDDFQYKRYIHRDVTVPMRVNFKILKGHLDPRQALDPDHDLVLGSAEHERIYSANGIKRIKVREGRIRGTLFIPEGDGPFPCVIDLFGTIGDLIEFRSAQLASRGIASLALAYFDYDDLPKELKELDIFYFEEAVKYLLGFAQIKKSSIGVLGVSKGGDLAVSIGTFIPEVKAVVCVNGFAANSMVPLKMKERTIPPLGANLGLVKVIDKELISLYKVTNDPEDHPESQIPVEEADAEFLFLCGEDDQSNDYGKDADRVASLLMAKGKSNYQIIKYEGAGHLLEPPYAPFAYATFHKILNKSIVWGGNALDHTAAEVDSWDRMIEFFKRVIV